MFIGRLATGGLEPLHLGDMLGFGIYDAFPEGTSGQKAEEIAQQIPELQQLIA
jgi:hypothetical protein